MLRTSPSTSPACASRKSAPTHTFVKGRKLDDDAIARPLEKASRASSSPARSASAMKTGWPSGSTATRPRWNGIRSTELPVRAEADGRWKSGAAATATSREKPAPAASRLPFGTGGVHRSLRQHLRQRRRNHPRAIAGDKPTARPRLPRRGDGLRACSSLRRRQVANSARSGSNFRAFKNA